MRRLKRAAIYVVMIAVVCTSIQVCLVANVGSQEKKVINLWHWMPAQVPEAAWDARLGYFMITHPNVDLRLEVTPFQGYTDKLLVAGAAGKLPDIFGTGGVTKVDVGLMGLAEPLGKYIESSCTRQVESL